MRAQLLAALALLPALPLSAQQTQMRSPENVQLTFHLIEADGFKDDDPEIRPIVTELRKLFRFAGYRLLSKSVLHATANPSSDVSQVLADNDGRQYWIHAHVVNVQGDLSIEVELNTVGVAHDGSLINASVRLKDGKTVVLGSARLSRESGALILAVTPSIDH